MGAAGDAVHDAEADQGGDGEFGAQARVGAGEPGGEAFGDLGAEVGAQDVAVVAVQRGEGDAQQRVGAALALAGHDVPDHVPAECVQRRVQQRVGVGVEGHHAGEQGVLVAEVLQDQRRAHPGALGDGLEGDVGVRVPGQEVAGGLQDGGLGGLGVPASGGGRLTGWRGHGPHAPSSASSRAPRVALRAHRVSAPGRSPGMDRAAAQAARATVPAMAKASW